MSLDYGHLTKHCSRKRCNLRGISTGTLSSGYRNPRYPPDTTQYQNWINLSSHSREYDNRRKVLHIESMVRRKEELAESPAKCPPFLDLMYQLRTYAVVLAYFPEGSKYHKVLETTRNHPGWTDFMTVREHKLLQSLSRAVCHILSDHLHTDFFDRVDILFGEYRHDRWVLFLDE